MQTTLIVPMIGKGERMKSISSIPKPFIKIGNKRIVELAVHSALKMVQFSSILYLLRSEHEEMFHKEISNKLPKGEIQIYPDDTLGPAHTLHLARMKESESFYSVDCDLIFEGTSQKYQLFQDREIQLFWSESSNPGHSFLIEQNGNVERISEKELISNQGVIGFYGFKAKSLFDELYLKTKFKDEHYVSEVVGVGINQGLNVKASRMTKHYPLGTSEEFYNFQLNRSREI
jgi:NDP-sugar pyrophosphorylase family protein